jgi:hypothetical protein
VNRFTCHGRPAGGRRSVESMWMLPVPFGGLGVRVVRNRVQEPVLEQVEGAIVGPAEPLTRLDHLVENRLDPRAPSDGAEDAADRAVPFAQVLELASELSVVGGHPGHLLSLGPAGRGVSPRGALRRPRNHGRAGWYRDLPGAYADHHGRGKPRARSTTNVNLISRAYQRRVHVD